ncbi:protein spaetzle-like isoform X1 [Bombus vosnesenskii]|uniref:Protein spaetzle-like isoform X1 n=2 Tax=Bombus vosnesenskii TaxID=207650 RepID=A0A6J3LE57_9HYME|nr:protein spaetzle-like isoform X1 [Bombus vosnesenskii]
MLLNRIGFLLLILPLSMTSPTYETTQSDNPQLYKPAPICKDKTYCENALYYPTDIVSRELRKNPHLRDYATVDDVDSLPGYENELEDKPLCLSTEQLVFPKLGITKNLEWKYIVNHEDLVQAVRIETCLEESQPCKVIDGFAEGYYTKCKQKFIYRQLLSLTDNSTITNDYFAFPVNCCCHVEFKVDKFLHSFNSHKRLK